LINRKKREEKTLPGGANDVRMSLGAVSIIFSALLLVVVIVQVKTVKK
jgi:hypothetical protein